MLAVITNQSPSIDRLLLNAFGTDNPTDLNSSDQIDDLFSTYLSFISHPQDDEDLDEEVSQHYILQKSHLLSSFL